MDNSQTMLILEKINTKEKAYNYFDKESNTVKNKHFTNMFKLNNGQIVVITKDKNLTDFNSGIIIFNYIKNISEVMDRYNKFRNKQDFWDFINSLPSIETQIERHKKFGNCTVQDEILNKLGLTNVNFAYCNISYFCGEYKFNIVAIDKALKEKYEVYKDNMSMQKFISYKFGTELAAKFKEYI